MTGPVQLIAQSRRRLALSFAIGLVPLFGVAVFASRYIQESSDSPSLDLVLITGWMLLALAVAYIGALFLADLVFGRVWREVNILGRRPEVTARSESAGADASSAEDDDIELAALGVANRSQALPLALFVILMLVVLIAATHQVTGGFFAWYARYGYATSTLRGDDSARKIAILEEMTRAQDDRLVHYTELMEAQLDGVDTPPEVRVQAVLSLGEVGRRMVRSTELIQEGKPGAEWTLDLHRHMDAVVTPKLLIRLKATSDHSETAALVFALGELRVVDALPAYRAYVRRADRDRGTVRAIVRALASTRDPRTGLTILMPLLGGEDAELASLAVWAVGEMYGLGTGAADEAPPDAALVALLAQRLPVLPFATQCVALDALLRIRSEQLAKVLFHVFDAVDPVDRRCQRVELERPFQAPLLVSREEELREKVVQALAAIAEGNSEVMSWLRARSRDEKVADGLRNDMHYILDVLAERRSR